MNTYKVYNIKEENDHSQMQFINYKDNLAFMKLAPGTEARQSKALLHVNDNITIGKAVLPNKNELTLPSSTSSDTETKPCFVDMQVSAWPHFEIKCVLQGHAKLEPEEKTHIYNSEEKTFLQQEDSLKHTNDVLPEVLLDNKSTEASSQPVESQLQEVEVIKMKIESSDIFKKRKKCTVIQGNKNWCSACDKAFTNPASLKKHTKRHQEGKQHKCEICYKEFYESNHLKVHMRSHTGDKPYICYKCNTPFSHLNYLKKHMRTHTGETPYTCETCNKSFSRGSTLKRHQITHASIKPYDCQQCGQAFNQAVHLREHCRIHAGIKPYICAVCRKAFRRAYHLKLHLGTHERQQQRKV